MTASLKEISRKASSTSFRWIFFGAIFKALVVLPVLDCAPHRAAQSSPGCSAEQHLERVPRRHQRRRWSHWPFCPAACSDMELRRPLEDVQLGNSLSMSEVTRKYNAKYSLKSYGADDCRRTLRLEQHLVILQALFTQCRNNPWFALRRYPWLKPYIKSGNSIRERTGEEF